MNKKISKVFHKGWLLGGFLSTSVAVQLSGCMNSDSSPKLSYAETTVNATKGVAITPDIPIPVTGTFTKFSIAPPLPPGLLLNDTTGIISGTPTDTATQNSYLVTASGSGGSAGAVVAIRVNLPAMVEITPKSIGISLPKNNPQYFFIKNIGGNNMHFSVADNGALGGFLNVSPDSGEIDGAGVKGGEQSVLITVSVSSAFSADTSPGSLVGSTLVLNIYTPQASNATKSVVNVFINTGYNIPVNFTGSNVGNIATVSLCNQYNIGPGTLPCNQNSAGNFAVGVGGQVLKAYNAFNGQDYNITNAGIGGAAFPNCTITSGGSGVFGPVMPPVVLNCDL